MQDFQEAVIVDRRYSHRAIPGKRKIIRPSFKIPNFDSNKHRIDMPKNNMIGIAGDVHLFSRDCNPEGFRTFLRYSQDFLGISVFLLSGDLVEGDTRNARVPVSNQGYEAASYLDRHMTNGSILYAIPGNHDTYEEGCVLSEIQEKLSGRFVYMSSTGQNFARIDLGGVKVDMLHDENLRLPRKGNHCAFKSLSRRYNGSRPDIIVAGHTHMHVADTCDGMRGYLPGGYTNGQNGSYVARLDASREGLEVTDCFVPVDGFRVGRFSKNW